MPFRRIVYVVSCRPTLSSHSVKQSEQKNKLRLRFPTSLFQSKEHFCFYVHAVSLVISQNACSNNLYIFDLFSNSHANVGVDDVTTSFSQKAVIKKARVTCKCHGVSGSCKIYIYIHFIFCFYLFWLSNVYK